MSPYLLNQQTNGVERKVLTYNKIPTNTCRRNNRNREVSLGNHYKSDSGESHHLPTLRLERSDEKQDAGVTWEYLSTSTIKYNTKDTNMIKALITTSGTV